MTSSGATSRESQVATTTFAKSSSSGAATVRQYDNEREEKDPANQHGATGR